jgi:molecular chaperone GrpE
VQDESSGENGGTGPVRAPSDPEIEIGTAEVEEPAAETTAPDPLAVAQQEAARLKDQLVRMAADFDNFRKRSRREASDAEKKGREDIIRDLLPVFDNIERAVTHTEKATDVQSVQDGLRMVIRQFADTLGKLGIERIPSVGQPFDPSVHEAIQQMETAEHPPGTVAAEIQGGYRANDRLIRPAMVVVAKAVTKAPTPTSGD